jgi:hypothetical protein
VPESGLGVLGLPVNVDIHATSIVIGSHDIGEIDAEVRAVLTEVGTG